MSSRRGQGSYGPRPRGRGSTAALRGSQTTTPHGNRHDPKRMELIASVSRSSGLEKDGDTLKDPKIQEEYRRFIQNKVDDVLAKHPRRYEESEEEHNQRINAQENLLILFRKLREGVSSSRRQDPFALEVYETSLYLSIVFGSPARSNSIIPQLIPQLYISSRSSDNTNRLVTTLISLLHYLVDGYPSQSSYRQHLSTIPTEFLESRSSGVYAWVASLAKSLRTQSYATFETLTRRTTIARLLADDYHTRDNGDRSERLSSLGQQSLYTLVHLLQGKVQANTWAIICSAYRELSCNVEETQIWLSKTLCLQPVVSYGHDMTAEQWLQQQSALGHTKRKEGSEGKWLIYRVRY